MTAPENTPADAPKNAAMITGYNTLGLALFRTLAKSAGNVVMSPLSIGVTLAMGLAAAAGETAEEIGRALAFDGMESDLFQANADLLRRYRQSAEALRLRLANALVLTQHGDAVVQSYRELLAESFAAEVFAGDIVRLNQWVAQQTEGKIERALDELPPDDIAVLVNAIYFKAPWEKPFNPTKTYDGHFVVGLDDDLKDVLVKIRMMDQRGEFVTVSGRNYRAARLPYRTPSLGMIVVLPDELYSPEALLGDLDTAELARLRAEFARVAPAEITLRLPRFRAQTQASLKPALQKAGMALAFDWTRADFSRMTERPPAEIPVAISEVMHCALIDVAEEGTEATAVTLHYYHIGGAGGDFIVTRPFLFFIVDETTGAILFQGKISDPS